MKLLKKKSWRIVLMFMAAAVLLFTAAALITRSLLFEVSFSWLFFLLFFLLSLLSFRWILFVGLPLLVLFIALIVLVNIQLSGWQVFDEQSLLLLQQPVLMA